MGAAAKLAGPVIASALLLDEMFSGVIAAQLRERGLDAIGVVEDPERVSTPDEELLAYAAERQRVLVTANIADFAVIARVWRASGRAHHGVVYVANRSFPRDRAFVARSSPASPRCRPPTRCRRPAPKRSSAAPPDLTQLLTCTLTTQPNSPTSPLGNKSSNSSLSKPSILSGTYATVIGRSVAPCGAAFRAFVGELLVTVDER